MDENNNKYSFEPDVTDTTYRNHKIQDESHIFEEETVQQPESVQSVFEQSEAVCSPYGAAESDQPTEEALESEQPVNDPNSGWQSTVHSQPQYDQYRFARQEPQNRTAQPGADTQRKKAKKEKKKSGFGKKLGTCIVLAIVFGLISGGIFLGVAKVGGNLLDINTDQSSAPAVGMVGDDTNTADTDDTNTSPAVETSADVSGNYTVAQVAQRCMPAMVAITNKSIQEIPNYFGFGSQNYESENSGSGIIVSQNENELLIATNNHVVSGADTLTVCFVDDALVDATIKGTDVDNDLAVISVKLSDIPQETLNQIKVIQIGDSDELVVGDQVVAIGNALGYGQSVSAGYVSALNREVTIDNTTYSLIQTDAAINPGNSGGALLNMKGELIGINESKYADTAVEGMGYAIPVSTATPILSNLMSRETRYKVDEENASYIGITCKDISSEFAEMYNVPTGVYIDSVVEGGPAASAGLQKGDIITAFADTKISSYSDLIAQLEYYAADEIVEITFYRTDSGVYTEQKTSLILGSRKDSELEEQDTETEIPQSNEYDDSEFYGNQGGQNGFDFFDFFGY